MDHRIARELNRIAIYVPSPYSNEWSRARLGNNRKLDSVVLKAGQKEAVVGDLQRFFASRERYETLGIPWRRGYLLYGPPGTGKTSLVTALASELSLNVCVLSLASPNVTDEKIGALLSSVPTRSIILIEDVDAFFQQRSKADVQVKVSYSGFINALDGVASHEGSVVFLTTNHPDRIDEAAIRSGRVDFRMELGPCDSDQLERMFLKFFDDARRREALRRRRTGRHVVARRGAGAPAQGRRRRRGDRAVPAPRAGTRSGVARPADRARCAGSTRFARECHGTRPFAIAGLACDRVWEDHDVVIAPVARPSRRSHAQFHAPGAPRPEGTGCEVRAARTCATDADLTRSRRAHECRATPPGVAGAGAVSAPPRADGAERRLAIGVDINLKGVEISNCDVLVIEGNVDATVHSKAMEILAPGRLNGTATIDIAEIHGTFEGELTARTRLVVHGTGRVTGTIRYGSLVVAEGGSLTGELTRLEPAAPAVAVPVAAPSAAAAATPGSRSLLGPQP